MNNWSISYFSPNESWHIRWRYSSVTLRPNIPVLVVTFNWPICVHWRYNIWRTVRGKVNESSNNLINYSFLYTSCRCTRIVPISIWSPLNKSSIIVIWTSANVNIIYKPNPSTQRSHWISLNNWHCIAKASDTWMAISKIRFIYDIEVVDV